MTLAIGIPTHNRPDSLARLCQSLLGLGPQVLIADDGSDCDLAPSVPATPQFSLERYPNVGIATNRNRLLCGLFAEKTVDVALLLDDDMEVCSPRALWIWETASRRHGLVAWRFDRHGAPCMPSGPSGGAAIAITRGVFEQLGYFDTRYDAGWGHEDSDWFRRRSGLTGRPLMTMSWGLRHHGGKGERCSPEKLAHNAALFAAG